MLLNFLLNYAAASYNFIIIIIIIKLIIIIIIIVCHHYHNWAKIIIILIILNDSELVEADLVHIVLCAFSLWAVLMRDPALTIFITLEAS